MKTKPLFISHASEDGDLASHVLEFLESRALKCWMAPRDIRPSADWAESIIDAIDSASGMVLLVSRHSSGSPQVRRELERAVGRGLAIYPLFIEKFELSKWMQYYISPHQWHDASDVSMARKLEELLNAVRDAESEKNGISDLDSLSELLAQDLADLAAALDSSEAGSERLLPGERRKVAVLHVTAALTGQGAMYHARAAVSRTVENLVTRNARLHGAYLEHLPFGGYRCLFGLEQVREDDDGRALSCGISLLNGFGEVNAVLGKAALRLEFGLGIASGMVGVEKTGEEAAAVHGEALISARELACAASGDLLATAAFSQADRSGCSWEEAPNGAFRVSGGRSALPGSRMVSVSSPFLGRDEEMKKLTSLLERQVSGAGTTPLGGSKHIVMRVTGEAGIGKSRLVHEFIVKHCTGAGFHVLRGQTLSFAQPPFWAWTTALRTLSGFDPGTAHDYGGFLAALLRLRVSDEVLDSAPFLASLLSIESGDPRLEALDERALTLEIRIGFGRLLKALSGTARTVVVLEDAHWLEAGDRGILEFALENCVTGSPIIFLLVARPDSGNGQAAGIAADPSYTVREEIELAEVKEPACLELVEGLLRESGGEDGSVVSPEAFRFIMERSRGNPFYIQELVNHLVERGCLSVREGLWALDDRCDQAAVPESLTGLIQSRLERLPDSWRAVLQNSSVLGVEFQLKLYWKLVNRLFLGRCHQDVFDGLEDRRLLYSRMSDFDRTYLFSHILVHDTAYASIMESNLRTLHRAAAEALEEMFQGELTRISGILMHHYDRAGDPDKAMEWGFTALEHYGGEEALKLSTRLEEMIEELKDSDDRQERLFRLLSQRDRALDLLGMRDQQGLVVERMMEIASSSGDDFRKAVALKKRGALARVTGRLDQAREWLEEALELARSTDDRAFEGIVLGNLGAIDLNQGRFEHAREYFEKALKIHRDVGDRRSEGIIVMNLGIVHKNLGRVNEARACYESALETAQRTGDRRTAGDVLSNMGSLLWTAGSLDEAAVCYAQALEKQQEIGNRRSAGITLSNLAILQMSQGLMDEALESYGKALETVRETGDLLLEGNILGNLGVLHAERGAMEEARPCYERALEIHRTTGNRPYEGITLGNLGNVYSKLGNPDMARSLYNEALEVVRAVKNRAEEANVLSNLGCLNIADGRVREASDCHRDACRMIMELKLDSTRLPGFAELHEKLLSEGLSPEWPANWEPGG